MATSTNCMLDAERVSTVVKLSGLPADRSVVTEQERLAKRCMGNHIMLERNIDKFEPSTDNVWAIPLYFFAEGGSVVQLRPLAQYDHGSHFNMIQMWIPLGACEPKLSIIECGNAHVELCNIKSIYPDREHLRMLYLRLYQRVDSRVNASVVFASAKTWFDRRSDWVAGVTGDVRMLLANDWCDESAFMNPCTAILYLGVFGFPPVRLYGTTLAGDTFELLPNLSCLQDQIINLANVAANVAWPRSATRAAVTIDDVDISVLDKAKVMHLLVTAAKEQQSEVYCQIWVRSDDLDLTSAEFPAMPALSIENIEFPFGQKSKHKICMRAALLAAQT